MEIMAKAWLCQEGGDAKKGSQIDYAKLASMCGMTNKGSASNAWTAIKKKIIAQGGGAAGLASPTKKGKGKGGKENDAGEAGVSGSDDDAKGEVEVKGKANGKKRGAMAKAEGESPSKKGKGGGGRSTNEVKAEPGDEGEDVFE
ncbi:hypothetical protein LTR53_016127 [Teratosphaeriaceae sp. CCFEE 6253]|nr:hypothetical protein LTR53_016127 [Teratosphaeriaceae sp. CCFEE 6253]